MAKSLLEEYNLPLSPRGVETMLISALKQKILSNLPSDITPKNIKPINTILKEKARFDICIGNKDRYIDIEIKIIETIRALRESIGNLALLDLKNNDQKKFVGIIVAYIISSMGGKFYISEDEVSEAINALNSRSNKIFAIISKADRYQIIDSQFLDDFAFKILDKVKKEFFEKKMQSNNLLNPRNLYKSLAHTQTQLVQSTEISTSCLCPYLFK